MLEIIERLNLAERHDAVISLDYDSRKRGRLKTLTETSEDAGLFLERGQVLMDGDYLKATDGRVVLVQAAVEQLTRASTTDPVLFAKICYHLGNRHTPVEIQPGSVFFPIYVWRWFRSSYLSLGYYLSWCLASPALDFVAAVSSFPLLAFGGLSSIAW